MAKKIRRHNDDADDFLGDSSGEPEKAPEVGKIAKVTASGEKISVGCKLPNGLRLRNFRMIESSEPMMGGGRRQIKVAEHIGEDIILHGTATPFGVAPKWLIVDGYAITPNVDKDAFMLWLKDNANSPLVKNKIVIYHEKADHVTGQAAELTKVRSGLEPLDPVSDPRRPRPRVELDGVSTANFKS